MGEKLFAGDLFNSEAVEGAPAHQNLAQSGLSPHMVRITAKRVWLTYETEG